MEAALIYSFSQELQVQNLDKAGIYAFFMPEHDPVSGQLLGFTPHVCPTVGEEWIGKPEISRREALAKAIEEGEKQLKEREKDISAARSILNGGLFCDCEERYSIEPHGDGYAIYFGRCMHKHGYNLAQITECDPKILPLIEKGLNDE